MEEASNTFELMEPAPPGALVPDHGLWPWLAAAAATVILLVAAWMFLRKRKPAGADLPSLRKAAYNEAKSALEKTSPATCRETAVVSSLILRKYLSAAANDPALFETHEEFISRQDSLQALKPEARAAAEAGFSRLASLKYAPEIPEEAPDQVIAESRALLETLHQGFAA